MPPSAATTPIRYKYIISKTLDPIFALFIGFSAAALRIRREELEHGRGGARESFAVLVRRMKLAMGGSTSGGR